MRLKVGNLTISKIVEDNAASLPLTFGFPGATQADIDQLRDFYEYDGLGSSPKDSTSKLNLHSFVFELGGKTFLIDACTGNHKPRSIPFFNNLDTPYLSRLQGAGYKVEDIDFVLCTHLHFDHVGWNTRLEDGRWVPTFPNAKYVFTKADYDYFDQHHDDPIYGPAFVDSVLPIMEHGLAELVATNHRVLHHLNDQVWLEGAPGHSPGSCMIHAAHSSDHAVFSGDLVHHPIQMLRPHLLQQADMDPALGCMTRAAVFDRIADTPTVLLPAHFGKSSAGTLHRLTDDSYRFEFLTPVEE